MEKLPICRICLAENVRMYVVVNRNLHNLYEKLTDIPLPMKTSSTPATPLSARPNVPSTSRTLLQKQFVTEDSRPILACYFCCTKLKQCHQLLRQCLKAEELFTQRMNEDYEAKSLINQNHLEFFSKFIKSPIMHISIDDECQTESIAMKEELPAVCKGQNDIVEPKEELQSEELKPDLDNSCVDVADIPLYHSESDSEDDVPLMTFKTEVEEEQEVSQKKRTARETTRKTVVKKPNLDTLGSKLEDAITVEQTKKTLSCLKSIRSADKRTSKLATYIKEIYKCDQRTFNRVIKMIQYSLTHTGEKAYTCDICQRSFSLKRYLIPHIHLHSGEKPYKCVVCQRDFSSKGRLTNHTLIHSGEKPYKCDVCQREFSVKNYLLKHSRIHMVEKPHKCVVCQRSFCAKGNLLNHYRVHTGERPYKCVVCQRGFTGKSYLLKHSLKHTGDKPYKCDVCQCSFHFKRCLITHISKHIDPKPYKCAVCQRGYGSKGALTKHVCINTRKSYTCDVCQRTFSVKYNLITHIRTHTNEKPFKCVTCKRGYCSKGALTNHFREHHHHHHLPSLFPTMLG